MSGSQGQGNLPTQKDALFRGRYFEGIWHQLAACETKNLGGFETYHDMDCLTCVYVFQKLGLAAWLKFNHQLSGMYVPTKSANKIMPEVGHAHLDGSLCPTFDTFTKCFKGSHLGDPGSGGHWKNITNRFVYPGMYPWEPQRQTWIRHQFGYINIRWISGNGIFFWRPRMGGLDSRSDQVAISPSGMSLRQDSRFVLKIPCKTRCICISLWTHDCIYFWAYTMDASLNHNSNCLLAY